MCAYSPIRFMDPCNSRGVGGLHTTQLLELFRAVGVLDTVQGSMPMQHISGYCDLFGDFFRSLLEFSTLSQQM